MNVLEMMKKDTQSVVGLTVEYDFGGTKPIVDVINDKIIAMLDLADPDFILELEESTYCGMDY